jgi:hypothetical protein
VGLLQDIVGVGKDALNEAQLQPILRERIALIQDRYDATVRQLEQCQERIADLERENANLRAQIPSTTKITFQPDTVHVLRYLFQHERDRDDREVDLMASRLRMERGVLQYHLGRLKTEKFAHWGGLTVDGDYWRISQAGRVHLMEQVEG